MHEERPVIGLRNVLRQFVPHAEVAQSETMVLTGCEDFLLTRLANWQSRVIFCLASSKLDNGVDLEADAQWQRPRPDREACVSAALAKYFDEQI